ncbi:hypothetical protein PR048_025946, partial [Dryococelus australis]
MVFNALIAAVQTNNWVVTRQILILTKPFSRRDLMPKPRTRSATPGSLDWKSLLQLSDDIRLQGNLPPFSAGSRMTTAASRRLSTASVIGRQGRGPGTYRQSVVGNPRERDTLQFSLMARLQRRARLCTGGGCATLFGQLPPGDGLTGAGAPGEKPVTLETMTARPRLPARAIQGRSGSGKQLCAASDNVLVHRDIKNSRIKTGIAGIQNTSVYITSAFGHEVFDTSWRTVSNSPHPLKQQTTYVQLTLAYLYIRLWSLAYSSLNCKRGSTVLCTNMPISTAHRLSAATVEGDDWASLLQQAGKLLTQCIVVARACCCRLFIASALIKYRTGDVLTNHRVGPVASVALRVRSGANARCDWCSRYVNWPIQFAVGQSLCEVMTVWVVDIRRAQLKIRRRGAGAANCRPPDYESASLPPELRRRRRPTNHHFVFSCWDSNLTDVLRKNDIKRLQEDYTFARQQTRNCRTLIIYECQKTFKPLLASHKDGPGSIPGPFAPDFRKWESCRTMPLVGGFSRRYPIFPALALSGALLSPHFTLIGSENLDIKSRPNLFTHVVRREHCTQVQSRVLSGDATLDTRASVDLIAPALPCLKRGKKVQWFPIGPKPYWACPNKLQSNDKGNTKHKCLKYRLHSNNNANFASANEHTSEARTNTGLRSPAYRSLNSRNSPIPSRGGYCTEEIKRGFFDTTWEYASSDWPAPGSGNESSVLIGYRTISLDPDWLEIILFASHTSRRVYRSIDKGSQLSPCHENVCLPRPTRLTGSPRLSTEHSAAMRHVYRREDSNMFTLSRTTSFTQVADADTFTDGLLGNTCVGSLSEHCTGHREVVGVAVFQRHGLNSRAVIRAAASERTAEAGVYIGLWSLAYGSLNSRDFPIPKYKAGDHKEDLQYVTESPKPAIQVYASEAVVKLSYRLARSLPTKANRVQSPARSPDFRMWGLCRTMPLVADFLGDLPFPPPLHSGTASYSLQSLSLTLKTSLSVREGVSSDLYSSQWRNDTGSSAYSAVKFSLMPNNNENFKVPYLSFAANLAGTPPNMHCKNVRSYDQLDSTVLCINMQVSNVHRLLAVTAEGEDWATVLQDVSNTLVRTCPGRLWTNTKPLMRNWPNHGQLNRKGKCVLTAAEANQDVAPARTCIGRLCKKKRVKKPRKDYTCNRTGIDAKPTTQPHPRYIFFSEVGPECTKLLARQLQLAHLLLGLVDVQLSAGRPCR